MLLYLRMDFDSLFLFEPDTKMLISTGMINPKPFTSFIRLRRCDLLVTFLIFEMLSVCIINQNFNLRIIKECKISDNLLLFGLRIRQNGT